MKRLGPSLLLVLVLGLLSTLAAAAHPLGNFSVNRYTRLEIARDGVELRYVLDLAEIPTLQELRAAGVEPGPFDDGSRQAFLAAKAQALSTGARLSLDGQPVAWSVKEMTLELLPGQADLDTMRVTLILAAPVAIPDRARLEYRDGNYAGRTGWHEVVVRGASDVEVVDATVPAADRTNELREYPQEAERAPLDVSSATGTLRWSATSDVRSNADPTVLGE